MVDIITYVHTVKKYKDGILRNTYTVHVQTSIKKKYRRKESQFSDL